MTRNAENYLVTRQGATSFLGIDRGKDPQDISPSKFLDGQNMVCSPIMGQIRTRDGFRPVVNSLFSEAFKIMPGARGKLYTPPNINGNSVVGGGNGTGYALTMGAFPNTGLYIEETAHPTQAVTFYVYGGAALGISSYSWTFGDGQSTSGSSTSVSNTYSTPGTFTVTVGGTGSDSKAYSATCSITIERKVGTVTPPVSPPSVAFAQKNIELTSAGSVTFSWVGKNASEGYLSITADGASYCSERKVATTGSQSVSITGSADAFIRVVATDGQEAFDDASAWVTDDGGGGSSGTVSCDIKAASEKEPASVVDGPLKLAAPGNVILSWTTSGATRLWIGSTEVTGGTALTVPIETTTTYTLTATNDAGNSATDSVTVEVGKEIPGADRRIVISGPASVNSGESATLSYIIQGHTQDGWVAMPSTGQATVTISSSTADWSGSSPEVLTYTSQSSKDGAAQTLTLRDGQQTGAVTFVAKLDKVEDGPITGATASHTVEVNQKQHDFDVQIVDYLGDDLPGPVYSLDETGVEFNVKITAKMASTAVVDTTFAGSARLLASISDYGDESNGPLPAISFLRAFPAIDGADTYDMDGNVIPAEAWESGVCYVTVKVVLADYLPEFPDWESFQELAIDVEEVL